MSIYPRRGVHRHFSELSMGCTDYCEASRIVLLASMDLALMLIGRAGTEIQLRYITQY